VLQLLATFARQSISIPILQHAIQVEVGDSFSDSRLAYTQFFVRLDSLPEVSFQHGQANVVVLLFFLSGYNIQNHVVILVQVVHAIGFDSGVISTVMAN